MNILAVDDERMALSNLVKHIQEAVPDSEIHAFMKIAEALEFVKATPCEVAFLDIQMRGMTGIELAKHLKDIVPDINIIFVTGYSEYSFEAIGVRASGYLMKPVSSDDIKEEMENLRNPVASKPKHRVRVQTFGNFEIYCEGEPVHFSRSRSKELLAYLVDIKGTSALYAEVAAILWEDGVYDRARQRSMSNLVQDIKASLKAIHAEDIFESNRKTIRVNIEKFDCDYYDLLRGSVPAINSYAGKYMSAYSWAELTVAYLNSKL